MVDQLALPIDVVDSAAPLTSTTCLGSGFLSKAAQHSRRTMPSTAASDRLVPYRHLQCIKVRSHVVTQPCPICDSVRRAIHLHLYGAKYLRPEVGC